MSARRPPDEDTAVIRADDTAAFAAVQAEPPPAPPPTRFRPEDQWPWLLLVVVVAAGILVWAFLFRGSSNRHVVPRVVGLRQPAAIAKLNDAGFDVTAVRLPSRSPGGRVFAQKPGAGSQLKKGQKVTIDVSSGARPVASKPKTATSAAKQGAAATPTKVAMPGVTGKPLADAGAAVATAGLVPESAPVAAGAAAGTVVSQSPGAGAQVPAGSAVRLNVAQGSASSPVSVPNVTGQSTADALSKLWAAKLTARTRYRKGTVGAVLEQQPGAGQAPAYTQVTLYVGR